MTEKEIHYIKREVHYTGIEALSPPKNISKAEPAMGAPEKGSKGETDRTRAAV